MGYPARKKLKTFLEVEERKIPSPKNGQGKRKSNDEAQGLTFQR